MTSFSSYDELKEFVATLPSEQRAFVSFRAAAHCLPILLQLAESTKYEGAPDAGLGALRATLAANVAARSSSAEITYQRNKAEVASSKVQNVWFYSDGIEHASLAVGHAVLSRWEEEECYRCLIQSVMSAREFSPDLQIEPFDPNTAERIEITDTDYPIEDLFADLSFMDGRGPEEFFNEPIVLRPHEQDAWDAFLARLGDQPNWSFWGRWFGGVLVGKLLPLELLLRIVLEIGDEVWERGPEAVAEAIREIEFRWSNHKKTFDDPFYGDETARGARKDVADRRKDVLYGAPIASKDRLGIGGNNPPVELEDYQELEEGALIIWANMTGLETHLEQEKPVRADVEATLQELEGATNGVRKWLTNKADLTVDTLIKWGVPPLMLFILSKVAELDALINALKVWVQFL